MFRNEFQIEANRYIFFYIFFFKDRQESNMISKCKKKKNPAEFSLALSQSLKIRDNKLT